MMNGDWLADSACFVLWLMCAYLPAGYFVTIAGGLSEHPKPGVNQSRFINSATNLANLPELAVLTAFAEKGQLKMPRLTTFGLSQVKLGFTKSATHQTVGKIVISVSNATAATV